MIEIQKSRQNGKVRAWCIVSTGEIRQ